MVIMDHTESVGSLEEQALKRKERLKNLKRKNPNGDTTNDSSSEIVPLPKPKFRSYKPQDESLQEAKIEDAKPVAVEDEVKDLLEAGKERQKGTPLRKEEVMGLINLVECNPILNSKITNAAINRLKEATWIKLAKEFNATIASHPRKTEQLKLKWDNLKKNARKRSSNIRNNILQAEYGIPDYIHPDDILDRVSAILDSTTENLSRQCSSDTVDTLLEETLDVSSVLVVPPPNDHEYPIECVEVCEENDTSASGVDIDIPNTQKDSRNESLQIHSNVNSGRDKHQNLLTKELDSRIYRNNAIAEYYNAKKRKIEEELILKRDILLLEKKKVEIQILDLEKNKSLIIDNEKLLLQKSKLQLEILEMQKKHSFAESIFRGSSEGI